jgi:Undecaprenyl-phosphate galactose phosphotransferase WbaP
LSEPETTPPDPSSDDDALLGDFPDIPTDIVKRAELFADLTRIPTRPTLTILVHLICDVSMLGTSTALAVLVWSQFTTKSLEPSLYWIFAIAIAVFVSVYAGLRLYPLVAQSPVEELRKLTLGTTIVYMGLATSTFFTQSSETFSRGVFAIGWVLSVVLVPLGRGLLRYRYAKAPWWGYPVIVLGAGKTGERVVAKLKKDPGLGLKPIGLLDDDPNKLGEHHGIPVIGTIEEASHFGTSLKMRYAIVAMPGVKPEKLVQILETHASAFTHVLVIPDLFGFSSLAVPAKELGGMLSLEVRQQLLLPWPRFIKRTVEIIFCTVGGALIFPMVLLIMLAIKLDSRGPVFYGHKRLGYGGKHFKAWKFRSMVQDSDKVLKEHLAKNPEAAKEWDETQKLRNDPRVGRVGALLRKTSLDELPQVWNVLVGDMSLVGPRPIVDDEVRRYGAQFELYKKVRPGITGLWQVSGRSDTTYGERVELDTYYVRNWSLWLDIYTLVRTVRVVLLGSGAY